MPEPFHRVAGRWPWLIEWLKRRALDLQGPAAQCLGQAKRERTAGKHLCVRVPTACGIWGHETELLFNELARGIPQRGRGAFGYELESIMPGTLANRPQRAQSFLEELDQHAGVVSETRQFHFDCLIIGSTQRHKGACISLVHYRLAAVAQILNLLYRRIVFGGASGHPTWRPLPAARRVQLCATAEYNSALRRGAKHIQARSSPALRCVSASLRLCLKSGITTIRSPWRTR